MTETAHIVEARDLLFGYDPKTPVLRGVSMAAAAGGFTCLLGPNGSGKTTLLRCLLGQIRPQQGAALLDGVPVGDYSPLDLARMVSYVPQFPTSTFAFTVREIILMGRYPHTGALGLAGRQDLDVADLAMRMTETADFAARTLEELSGGEAQRVMVARALAQQPSIMLLDEPTSHLDIRNQLLVYRLLQRVAKDWPMTVICVSHDLNVAARFADSLVLMRGGQILAAGAPADVIRKDLLEQTYDVDIELIRAGDSPVPFVWAK